MPNDWNTKAPNAVQTPRIPYVQQSKNRVRNTKLLRALHLTVSVTILRKKTLNSTKRAAMQFVHECITALSAGATGESVLQRLRVRYLPFNRSRTMTSRVQNAQLVHWTAWARQPPTLLARASRPSRCGASRNVDCHVRSCAMEGDVRHEFRAPHDACAAAAPYFSPPAARRGCTSPMLKWKRFAHSDGRAPLPSTSTRRAYDSCNAAHTSARDVLSTAAHGLYELTLALLLVTGRRTARVLNREEPHRPVADGRRTRMPVRGTAEDARSPRRIRHPASCTIRTRFRGPRHVRTTTARQRCRPTECAGIQSLPVRTRCLLARTRTVHARGARAHAARHARASCSASSTAARATLIATARRVLGHVSVEKRSRTWRYT